MKIELDKKEQEILITLLLNRISEIDIEMKSLSDKEKLKRIRLEKELKNTLHTLKKFENKK